MKVTVNDEQILELTETQKKVIKNDIHSDIFESDMARRLHYINDHPCELCIDLHGNSMRNLMKEKGVQSVSSDRMKFAEEYFKYDDIDLKHESEELVVKIDGKENHRITAVNKKLIKKVKACDSVNSHCKEQMIWVLIHKYERCLERLRLEWEPKLAQRNLDFPLDDEKFAELVFSQSDYKNRLERDILLV